MVQTLTDEGSELYNKILDQIFIIAQWESALVVGCHENAHFNNYLTIWKNLIFSILISLQKLKWTCLSFA